MKVRVSTDDEDTICRAVVAKLKGKHGISFEEIARTAYDEGRGRLATQVSIIYRCLLYIVVLIDS